MVRLIAVLTLVVALLGLAVVEQCVIDKVYSRMERDTKALIVLVEAYPDEEPEFGEEVIAKVDSMYHYWTGRERRMSILVRFADLSYISDALIYAKNFIEFDNKEETMAGLLRLQYLLQGYHNAYGISGSNIL